MTNTVHRPNLAYHLFVNKVSLRHCHAQLLTYHIWLLFHYKGAHMAPNTEVFTLQPLQKKVADPSFKPLTSSVIFYVAVD